jgi:hypothetical protein
MNINDTIIGKYCIVRCSRASVFAGIVAEREGQAVLIRDARRIWSWSGAASLSQLALDGTKEPNECKFTVACESVVVLDAIEIIPCTDAAQRSICGVKKWKI